MKLSDKINANRAAIIKIVESNNTLFPRLITDDLDFDLGEMHLDIVVDRTSEFSPEDIGKIQTQLESLLGVSVDVITPNRLRDEYRERVLASAVAI
ncbi:nucleotidyltransferase family protein [Methylophilus sp. Leaf408]|uniref:nucleotidyltransferase family protein n=1 Tax=Methylophilus sp. Leaf408 TaxID=2876561 RepID=UPI001E35A396|nr:nucleotidyltransferase [Methylophilus sp. Leaf408]